MKFENRDFYRQTTDYEFLPFRFLNYDAEKVLVVNEVGEYLMLNHKDFQAFTTKRLDTSSTTYMDLKSKHFLREPDSAVPVQMLATKYRTKKAHLDGFTKLHIFVVSLRCEHSCHYCQVSRVTTEKNPFDMTVETAKQALELVFRSPATTLKIEFQGGEPLLNFELIKDIIKEAELKSLQTGKNVEFVVATNLALATDLMLEFFKDHKVNISTSLDGPKHLHNSNRPRPGNNSYEFTIQNIRRARDIIGNDSVAALMTATKLSLKYPKEIIDEYLQQGFRSIFLRSLSPYGFALKTERRTGYTSEEFLDFYVEAFNYILDLNRNGTTFVELYAQLLLTRILTPFSTGYVDLQSPSGAGIGAVVYNYDGNIYASDESRMLAETGDKTFCLGNVHSDRYEEIFGGELLRSIVSASCIESLPGCADCAFQPYCGSDPVFNYATQGNMIGHRPTSDFHKKNFFLIKYFISLYESDPVVRKIFWSWIRNVDVSEVL